MEVRDFFLKVASRIIFAQAISRPGKNHTTRPLRGDEVCQILGLIPGTAVDDLVMRVAVLIGLKGGLRVAEYTAPSNSPTVTDQSKLLLVRRDRLFIYNDNYINGKYYDNVDLGDQEHFAILWFYKSKNNQILEREFASLPCTCEKGYCIVIDLSKLINLIKDCQPNTVLLTWTDGSYVTGSQVSNFLKNACLI